MITCECAKNKQEQFSKTGAKARVKQALNDIEKAIIECSENGRSSTDYWVPKRYQPVVKKIIKKLKKLDYKVSTFDNYGLFLKISWK